VEGGGSEKGKIEVGSRYNCEGDGDGDGFLFGKIRLFDYLRTHSRTFLFGWMGIG